MIKNVYTNRELNKKLKENGCSLKGIPDYWDNQNDVQYYKYDISYDVCVKFSDKFFKLIDINKHTIKIVEMLQSDEPKSKINNYIWSVCKFNHKNKENK